MQTVKNIELGPVKIRINWLVFACVLMTSFSFIQLGFWQYGRAEEKLAIQAEVEVQQQRNAVAIDNIDLSEREIQTEELNNLHVALQGEFVNERTILVLAQFFDGLIGYEVVTPFRLEANGQLVLVSRGWTTGILPPNVPPQTSPVEGQHRVTAQIHVPDENERIISSQIDASQWPIRVRSIELPILESLLNAPLFPYVVRLTEDQPGMLVRHWPQVNVDINNNLSYAFQWFLFAALVLLGSLFASSNLKDLLKDPEGEKFK